MKVEPQSSLAGQPESLPQSVMTPDEIESMLLGTERSPPVQAGMLSYTQAAIRARSRSSDPFRAMHAQEETKSR